MVGAGRNFHAKLPNKTNAHLKYKGLSRRLRGQPPEARGDFSVAFYPCSDGVIIWYLEFYHCCTRVVFFGWNLRLCSSSNVYNLFQLDS
jgi:hypothetical protein